MNTLKPTNEAYSDIEKGEINTANKKITNSENIIPYIDLYDVLNRISEMVGVLKHKNIFKVSTSELINFQAVILLKALEAANVYKNGSYSILASAIFEKNKNLLTTIANKNKINLNKDNVVRDIVYSLHNRDIADLDTETIRGKKPLEVKSAHMKDYIFDGHTWVELEQPKNEDVGYSIPDDTKIEKFRDKVKRFLKKGADAYIGFFDKYIVDRYKTSTDKLARVIARKAAMESVEYKGFLYEAIDPNTIDTYIFALISQIEHLNIKESSFEEVSSMVNGLKAQLTELESL